jgi:hypothetical protein
MKTGTSTLMDSELKKSNNYAEEWDISSALEKNITVCNTFIPTPEYVGCYALGGNVGLKIYFAKRPKWLHRKMMKLCLGWEWIDN